MNAIQERSLNGSVKASSNVQPIGRAVIPETVKRQTTNSLMAKAEEKIELSKSTIWLIGLLFTVIGVILSAAPQMIGWIRNDESDKKQIEFLRKDVDTMKDDVKEIRKSMTEIEKENSKKNGYELGVTDAHNAPKDKK